ncbi:peroxiredoxin family protein [Halorussus litoreus]|uniref:peroxiredoxin family protein n=1 Tax=Halorussus litoreus TaxID=1710536 RepID=UPI000E22DA25|nr:redoxin domain-containing protein [Halorussus litoreus]
MADPDEVGAGPIPADPSETDQPTELDSERGADRQRGADRRRRGLGVSQLDFELPNAGTGPDPLSLSALADDADTDVVVLLFQRDHRCRGCREQVQTVADRYSEFRARDAVVVSVLPESKAMAETWQKKFHLPFPLVADEEKTVAAAYGQPTRWGKLGRVSDLLGRLPQTAILDARGGDSRLFAVHRGDGADDWPSVENVLAMVDRLLADEG